MSVETCGWIWKSCMPEAEIIFSKKRLQISDFESFIFWSKFGFLGTTLSKCFLLKCFLRDNSAPCKHNLRKTEASTRVFYKKMCSWKFGRFLKDGLRPATLFKKRLWHKYFPVSFAKFPRAPSLQNSSGWLLLEEENFIQQIMALTFSLAIQTI